MTGDSLTAFILFWGIWLMVPLMIDGVAMFIQLTGVWLAEWRKRRSGWLKAQLQDYPRVSLIIPVHNGAYTLSKTIQSIRKQTYPKEQLEVIVVDNGSTDSTQQALLEQQWQNSIDSLQWVFSPNRGKAWALNIGVYYATGVYIANVDADVELHPDAILNLVKAFQGNPELGAATGAIEIAKSNGEKKSLLRYLLQECESLEYLTAFRIGRQYQTVANNVFSLAGAFSFFRQDILLNLAQYSDRTVSEDTDITFWVHELFPNVRVGCIVEAIAYVEPTRSLSQLYSQRVRWQRGELEVAACHPKLLSQNFLSVKGLSPTKTLLVDHTLAFPRVVWSFILPMLFVFGYALPLVVSATIIMYLCYVVIDALLMATIFILAHSDARRRLARHWWLCVVSPIYKYMLFWFRFGGFIAALREPPQWHTEPPWEQAAQHGLKLINHAFAFMATTLQHGAKVFNYAVTFLAMTLLRR